MSKQALASLVCSGSKPSTITKSRGSTGTGRTSVPVEWSYTGLEDGPPQGQQLQVLLHYLDVVAVRVQHGERQVLALGPVVTVIVPSTHRAVARSAPSASAMPLVRVVFQAALSPAIASITGRRASPLIMARQPHELVWHGRDPFASPTCVRDAPGVVGEPPYGTAQRGGVHLPRAGRFTGGTGPLTRWGPSAPRDSSRRPSGALPARIRLLKVTRVLTQYQ